MLFKLLLSVLGAQRFSSDESSPENAASDRERLRPSQLRVPRLSQSLDEEAFRRRAHLQARIPRQDPSYSFRRVRLRQGQRSSNASQSDASCSPTGEDMASVSRANGHRRDMFEIFKTFEGEEYTVYVREDGKKFYVDWEEQVLRTAN